MDGLPKEIMSDILSRLPARCVLQCRSVCKHWRFLIDNPIFPIMHWEKLASQSRNLSSFILYPDYYFDNATLYNVDYEDDKALAYHKSSKIHLPISEPLSSDWSFAGSCNGLTCFKFFYTTYLYNPTTQDCVQLPPNLPHPKYGLGSHYSTHFGFDPFTKEFKVVGIFLYPRENLPKVQVYTLGSSSWRKLSDDVPLDFSFVYCSSEIFNGSIHWLRISPSDSHIVSFDLGRERFEVFPIPQIITSPLLQHFRPSLGVLQGCLYILDCCFDDRFEIWILKDYNVKESWAKQFTVSRYCLGKRRRIHDISPICLWENGELVMQCNGRAFVSYNFETGKAKKLQDDILPKCFRKHCEYRAFPYVRTLISPKSGCKIVRNLDEKEVHYSGKRQRAGSADGTAKKRKS